MENNLRYLDPIGVIDYRKKLPIGRSTRCEVILPQAPGKILLVGNRLVSTCILLSERFNDRADNTPYWVSVKALTREVYDVNPQPYVNQLKMGPSYKRFKRSLGYQENVLKGLDLHLNTAFWAVGRTNIDPKTHQLLDDDYVWLAPCHHMYLWLPQPSY